jgi:hypothetical protein
MGKIVTVALVCVLASSTSYAQRPTSAQQAEAEKTHAIVSGPVVSGITGTSATIKWTTNGVAANHVRYRPVGSQQWKEAFKKEGSADHSVTLSDLTPNTNYEYNILTGSATVRSEGAFQTAPTATGTMPDVAASSAGTSTPAQPGSTAALGAEAANAITQGPIVSGISGVNATINWNTTSPEGTNVKYRSASSGGDWMTANGAAGPTHSVTLSSLQPNQVYEYQIVTDSGQVRSTGRFQTASTATAKMPDVQPNR